MKHLGKSVNRILAARPVVWSLVLLLLLLWVAPSCGEEATGTPQALGYINSDGETGLLEFVAAEPLQEDLFAGTALGIPAEPPGHQLVRLTNAERANHGLPPLKAASELMNSSQYHSDWMASHNCFDHNCPGEPYWVTRIANAGYLNYEALGENIAAGYGSASEAVQAWMNSPGHRANMLGGAFREAGGGYAYCSGCTYNRYWAMDFGARDAVYPVVVNSEAWSTNSAYVQLYVYAPEGAQQMRFSNDGVTWSSWEPYSCIKAWTLSAANGSPAEVRAQIKLGSTPLESSDSIHILPPEVSPDRAVYFSVQASEPTMPVEYHAHIDSPGNWSASANQSWIKLSDYSGAGDATVQVRVEDFPTGTGTYTGKMTVMSFGLADEMQVTLVVTDEPLQEGYVPLVAGS
jgi:hypothetical protein